MTKLDKRLQQALEQLEAGSSLNEVMAELTPREASELGSLIHLAAAMREVPHPAPASSRMPSRMEELVRDLRASRHSDRSEPRGWAGQVSVLAFGLIMVVIFVGALTIPQVFTPVGSYGKSPDTSTPTVVTQEPTATVQQPLITLTPTPTSAPSLFAITGDGPVIRHGRGSEWDARFTDPGAVIYHDGMFHMFRNGSLDSPGKVAVTHMTSPDGLTWFQPTSGPVFTDEGIDYVGFSLRVNSVVVMADDTWALYFSASAGDTYTFSRSVIGRATAPSPEGPWMADAEPVLLPGAKGAWDGFGVTSPSVVTVGDETWMYYEGYGAPGTHAIGLATSPDGITWTKYDVLRTYVTALAESDPVFENGLTGEWDDLLVGAPYVIQNEDGFVMVYRSQKDYLGNGTALGVASSSDGITWVRSNHNPMFTPALIPGGRDMYDAALVYHQGITLAYLEASSGIGSATNIWLATYLGSLSP